jgi:RNA polymerase sigma factor (sigma-70 family)
MVLMIWRELIPEAMAEGTTRSVFVNVLLACGAMLALELVFSPERTPDAGLRSRPQEPTDLRRCQLQKDRPSLGAERNVVSPNEDLRRRQLLRAARRGDRRARERLVLNYLPLVHSLAAGYRHCGLPADDLVQEGCLGLLEAVDRYDAERGATFEPYARFRIRRSIRHALTEQARSIRLPKHIVERRRALDRAEARLAVAGQAATQAELSLDEPNVAGGRPLDSIVPDPCADPVTETIAHEQEAALRRAIEELPARQREIVAARWGLDDATLPSATSLARRLGVSPRRAQAIGRDALNVLRDKLEPAAR